MAGFREGHLKNEHSKEQEYRTAGPVKGFAWKLQCHFHHILLEKALTGSPRFKGVPKWTPALCGCGGQVHIIEEPVGWEIFLWPSLENTVGYSDGTRIQTQAI